MLARNYNRSSKHDPLVEEVELVEANPGYPYIRFQNGLERTVSLRDLAPVLVEDKSPTEETELNEGLLVDNSEYLNTFIVMEIQVFKM